MCGLRGKVSAFPFRVGPGKATSGAGFFDDSKFPSFEFETLGSLVTSSTKDLEREKERALRSFLKRFLPRLLIWEAEGGLFLGILRFGVTSLEVPFGDGLLDNFWDV